MTNSWHSKVSALLIVLAALVVLASCGEDATESASGGSGGETRTAANGDELNDADVAFATDMIPHHAQALVMVDLTLGRDLAPELARLAEDIRATQGPEIEQMVDWLTGWGEPVPETSRDHANAHGSGDLEDSDMPGMMSADEMAALEEAQGAEFATLWLEMMIEHHEGAIEMAQVEQSDGTFAPAVELAEDIAAGQQREVDAMEDLLAS